MIDCTASPHVSQDAPPEAMCASIEDGEQALVQDGGMAGAAVQAVSTSADHEMLMTIHCPSCCEPDFGYMPCCARCGAKYHAGCLIAPLTGNQYRLNSWCCN